MPSILGLPGPCTHTPVCVYIYVYTPAHLDPEMKLSADFVKRKILNFLVCSFVYIYIGFWHFDLISTLQLYIEHHLCKANNIEIFVLQGQKPYTDARLLFCIFEMIEPSTAHNASVIRSHLKCPSNVPQVTQLHVYVFPCHACRTDPADVRLVWKAWL